MNKKNFRLYDFLPLIALVVLVIVFGATSGGKLFTGFNLMSIITQSIPVIIGGMGVMFAVSMGGCDLSVGGVAAVSATVGAYLGSRYGLAVMILVSLVIGLASGCLVGAIVSRLHVPSFMVTLAEKSGRLGGNLHPAGAAFFKEDIAKLCSVLERRVAAAKVNVLLKTEVTPEFVREFDPDALIVAIGANELRPPIKGMDGPNVVMAIDAELHPEKLGRRVAIMGGGLVGGEAAISFAHEGREVSIIEMKGAIAEEVNSFYRGGLMPEIEKAAMSIQR